MPRLLLIYARNDSASSTIKNEQHRSLLFLVFAWCCIFHAAFDVAQRPRTADIWQARTKGNAIRGGLDMAGVLSALASLVALILRCLDSTLDWKTLRSRMSKSEWSSKCALVYDYGLFVEFAVTLARQFKKVYYFSPWKDAYPSRKSLTIGEGLHPNLHRVRDLWDVEDEVDVWVFPDVGDGDLQLHLKRLGYPVWGCFKGEELELFRWETKNWIKSVGLPLVPSTRFVGLDALEDYLRENDNLWVKVSTFRGSVETFHHETWALTEKKVAALREDIGELAHIMEFIIEEDLPDEGFVEIGYDGWNVHGDWPKTAMMGYEIKGEALAGVVKPYADFPKPVRLVNEKLSPALKEYGYCGNISTELRVDKNGQPFLIDPCARCGSPPGELMCELWENWAEIIWHAAVYGETVEPKPIAKYAFELMLYSDWVSKHWAPVLVPDDVRRYVKLAFSTRIRHDNVVPQLFKSTKIGAVIGFGDTLQDAIDHCLENNEQIEGLEIDRDLNAVEKAIDIIKEGEKHEINFFPEGEST